MTKKVTLLKHFKSYLKGQDEDRDDKPSEDEVNALKTGSGDQDMIYVKNGFAQGTQYYSDVKSYSTGNFLWQDWNHFSIPSKISHVCWQS